MNILYKNPKIVVPVYSNVTGIDTVDTTLLDGLKAQLLTANGLLGDKKQELTLHQQYYDENLAAYKAGTGSAVNVDSESNKIKTIKDQIKDMEGNIGDLTTKINAEQKNVNSAIDHQIALLSERAKTDPNALAQLKELEAQKQAFSLQSKSASNKTIIIITLSAIALVATIIFIVYKVKKGKKNQQ
jgi:hypothetical protein